MRLQKGGVGLERVVKQIVFPKGNKVKKKRVAAYARVSTGKDAMLHSLSAQVSFYSEYIQSHKDWIYAGVYTDEAITGTKDSRQGFQRLIADCKAGKIDLVITKSISRFARNTVTLLETVRFLKAINVDVYFEEQNIHSMSSDGELMLTILASYAQEESKSVSDNLKWRIRNNYKEGIPNTLNILGYDFRKGILTVNRQEAETVKMIFEWYISGMGRLAIVKRLNELGIKPKNNGEWDSTKIKEILCNEKYVGDLLLQKVHVADHLTKKCILNNGELPRYYVKDNHEAIIDRDLFDRVQEELKRREKQYSAKSKTTATYPYTGKIQCSGCGKNFHRKINNSGTKYQKAVWICSTYNTLGKEYCSAKQIPEYALDRLTTEFNKEIDRIIAYPNNVLKFIFYDDNTIVEKEWSY
jgi:DNA invertase Pin-like site-specific DNA recombinase